MYINNIIQNKYKSPYYAINLYCYNKLIDTDIAYFSNLYINNSSTSIQLFINTKSLLSKITA